MARKIQFAPLEYYHIYNRGTDKRDIFLNHRDYLRFLFSLFAANSNKTIHPSDWLKKDYSLIFKQLKINESERLVDIGAYCLMPNHFHLLVREKEEEGISRLMQKLQTAYSMYFNTKHDRSGNLFQGRFKAQHIDNDEYLNYLYAYIHLNPVKIKDPENWDKKIIKDKPNAEKFLKDYPYSSYSHYLGQPLPHCAILTPDAFPQYFADHSDFANLIKDWINFEPE